MPHEMPFDINIPVNIFEKADASPDKRRRIGGIASIQTKDKQDEVLLQRGLDFSEFDKAGWFNDNHSKDTGALLGYPDGPALYFRKGQVLPDTTKAKADGHWVEGYLVDTPRAKGIWDLGKALRGTNRNLSFSVEGKVQQRQGVDNKIVAKALVREVAITRCPVNTDSRMSILVKSLQTVEAPEPEDIEKTLAMGPVTTPGVTPPGVQTGEGAGQVISGQSLEQDDQPAKVLDGSKPKEDDEGKDKKLTMKKAIHMVKSRFPNATPKQIAKIVVMTRRAKSVGTI